MVGRLRHETRRILSRLWFWPPPWRIPEGYGKLLRRARRNERGFRVERDPMNEAGDHPFDYRDFECEFAAAQVSRRKPGDILDIGSYRDFVLGLSAVGAVTSLDVRERVSRVPGETVLTGDAKHIPLPDGSMDCVVSLCAIEHFGLGRYGDAFDLDADLAAAKEMARVLRPGGFLVFSTTITRGAPLICFNSHRIYSREKIAELVAGLDLLEEAFFSHRTGPGPFETVSSRPGEWDVYCGCFTKRLG